MVKGQKSSPEQIEYILRIDFCHEVEHDNNPDENCEWPLPSTNSQEFKDLVASFYVNYVTISKEFNTRDSKNDKQYDYTIYRTNSERQGLLAGENIIHRISIQKQEVQLSTDSVFGTTSAIALF